MHQKTQKRTYPGFIKIIALFLAIAALLIFIFYLYTQSQSKVIKQDILPNNYSFSVEYDTKKWNATAAGDSAEGGPFGYYLAGIVLESTKTYTEDNGEQKPVYEIRFRFEKNINAYIPNLKPGDEGWTGADNTKPEKPLPFKKDDFEYVTTVNGRGLYIAKTGATRLAFKDEQMYLVAMNEQEAMHRNGNVYEEYPNNTLSDYLDIFSNYNDVFNGQEQFRIVYIINDPSGSWQELKPELIKILKSMKVEKIK